MQTINYASLRGVRITLLTLSALLMTFLSYGRQIDFVFGKRAVVFDVPHSRPVMDCAG